MCIDCLFIYLMFERGDLILEMYVIFFFFNKCCTEHDFLRKGLCGGTENIINVSILMRYLKGK